MELEQRKQRHSSLILGAAGFIGTHLTSRLRTSEIYASVTTAGHGVAQRFAGSEVHVLEGMVNRSLLDRCAPPDVIFFLAGGSSVSASMDDPRNDFLISLPPLADVLDKMRTDWPQARLIFLSSAAVYGASGSRCTSVNSPPRPISPYGLHKRLSEEMIAFEQERLGLAVNVLRPFSVYGPGLRKQLLWDALRKADAGDPVFFGSGNESRDWIYVEDLVELLLEVSQHPHRFPPLFNVGSGIGVSVEEILDQLFDASGHTLRPTFMGRAKTGDPVHLVADAKEQERFRYYFHTPLEEGLRRYVEWCRGRPE